MQTNLNNNFQKSEIGLRIKTFIDLLGLKQNAFAEKLEISTGRLSNVLTGRNKPDSDFLEKIATVFKGQINTLWLLTGDGDAILRNVNFLRSQNGNPPIKSTNEPTNDTKTKFSLVDFIANEAQEPYARTIKIPIMDTYAGASSQGFLTQGYIDEKDTISLPSNMLQNGKKYVCFQVKGESMLPTLQHKDYVIAKFIELNDLKDDKIYAIVTQNQDMIIKRVQNHPNEGILVCYPDNIYHSSVKVRYEEIFQVFEVAARLTIHLDQTPLLENLERLFKSRK